MEWFNFYGLIFMIVIMIPNMFYAAENGYSFGSKWKNRIVEIIEQIGRYACIAFMIFNIPGTWFGWWSDEAFAVYLIVDIILVIAYCVIWVFTWKKESLFRALALSIIPAVLFLFSGIMSRSILLIIASLLFAPAHIMISVKNAG